MKLFFVPMVMALVVTTTGFTTTRGPPRRNLIGKMFTLSRNSGGISFYSSYPSLTSTPWLYTSAYPTRRYKTTTARTTPTFSQTSTTKPTTTPTTQRYKTTTAHTTPTFSQTSTTKSTTTPTTQRYKTTTARTTPTFSQTSTTKPTTTPTTQRYKTTTAHTTTTFSQTSTTKPTTTPTTQRYKTTTAHTTTTFSRTATTKFNTRPTTRSTTYPPWTTYPQWTTAPPTRGVSVCLRYLTDYVQDATPVIFTLSPSTTPLRLMSRSGLSYGLSFNSYSYPSLFLQPNIKFWSNTGVDIWTRLCLTVDTVKNVAQVFSGSSMSVRKILPFRYVWSGQPMIDFSGFDGQVTDVQIWDYPLCYREIYKYMVTGIYGPHRGSVLTWSSISYSPRGNVVMEDVYEQQLKGMKKTRKLV